jgi:Glycosyltransferase family 87
MTESDILPLSDSNSRYADSAISAARNHETLAAGSRARWAILLIALPFAVQAIAYLRTLLQLVVAHNEAGYPEGVCVYGFLTAAQTNTLYLPPFNFPWNAQIYGPLFLMVGTFFAKVFHGDPTPTTVLMRFFSFAALLGSMALVGYLCWRLERRKSWAAVAVIMGLACFWLLPYSSTARPDTPSIFLFLAALVTYELAEGRGWIFFLAGVFGAFSFLTKQNTAPLLLALFLDCLLARRFKGAAIFVAGGVIASAPILGTLWFSHEPFLENFTVVKLAIRDWSSIPRTIMAFVAGNPIAVISICIALMGVGLSWREKRYRSVLLVTAFACLSHVAALANPGASWHYLMLPWILTMLFVPAGLRLLERWTVRQPWIPSALLALATIILIQQRRHLAIKPLTELNASVVGNLNMLSDIPYLELRSRQPQLLDPFLYNELSKQRVWSDMPIRQSIDAESYDLLLIAGKDGTSGSEFLVLGFRGTSLWGADVVKEMTLHYRVLCETPDHLALVPLDRTSSLRTADIAEIFNQPCRSTDRRPQVSPGYS